MQVNSTKHLVQQPTRLQHKFFLSHRRGTLNWVHEFWRLIEFTLLVDLVNTQNHWRLVLQKRTQPCVGLSYFTVESCSLNNTENYPVGSGEELESNFKPLWLISLLCTFQKSNGSQMIAKWFHIIWEYTNTLLHCVFGVSHLRPLTWWQKFDIEPENLKSLQGGNQITVLPLPRLLLLLPLFPHWLFLWFQIYVILLFCKTKTSLFLTEQGNSTMHKAWHS